MELGAPGLTETGMHVNAIPPQMSSFRFARALLPYVAFATCIAPFLCNAQQADRSAMHMVLGCWNVTAGPFTGRGPTGAGVDPGQTTLPSIGKFDSLPGPSDPLLNAKPMGHLIQGITGYTIPMYRSGYYHLQQRDRLEIVWHDFSDDMRLVVGVDSLVMRGRAEAGTDYDGYEHAPVVLRRTTCSDQPDAAGVPVDVHALQITAVVEPAHPTRKVHDGWFTFTILVTNPRTTPVVVDLAPRERFAQPISFSWRADCRPTIAPCGSLATWLGSSPAPDTLDAPYFLPGETKRYAVRYRIDPPDTVGSGLPAGAYAFTGYFGRPPTARIASKPLTVMVGP